MASLRDLADRMLGRGRPEPVQVPTVPTGADILAELDRFQASIDDRVPPMVEARVQRICAIVRDTVPRLDQLGAGSPQAHSVMATATSYLPEAVGGYLRLPRAWADSRPVSGGKTSLMVLCDQLDLLAVTMDRVFDAVCRADAAALVAHGAFLAEKFGSGSTLTLGAQQLGARPPAPPADPAGSAGSA